MVVRSRTRPADTDIIDLQPHEIAAPEFAVDREVEQGEVAGSALHLEKGGSAPLCSLHLWLGWHFFRHSPGPEESEQQEVRRIVP